MPEPTLSEVDWIITFTQPRSQSAAPPRTETVRAAYYRSSSPGEMFLEFKDTGHRLVYAVATDSITSIRRGN